MNTNNRDNITAQSGEQPIAYKHLTIDKLKEKVQKKLDAQRGGEFDKKFEAKYKELASAEAIVRNINKELEKMYIDYDEGL